MEEANQISSKMEKVFLFGSHLGIYGAFLFGSKHDSQLSVVLVCVKKSPVLFGSVFVYVSILVYRRVFMYICPDYTF